MNSLETTLPGVYEIRLKVHQDARGYFVETYHRARFAECGIDATFVQDNHSLSAKNTLRGLHYQLKFGQAKLCRVVEGEALDIAVDVRIGSPTFGKWASVLLSAKEQNQIYIPAGFAHGFLALTDRVQFLYKCSDFYNPSDERGIVWNDPTLAIEWNVESPIISAKDVALPKLADISADLLPKFPPR